MPDRRVISNTSPLLYLHQAGCLNLLPELYQEITAPVAVRIELEEGARRGIDVPDLDSLEWCTVETVAASSHDLRVELGPGETEVLLLGLEVPDSLLILDDRLARAEADRLALPFTGTLGIVLKAKQMGLLDTVQPILVCFQESGMWLHPSLVATILALAEERS